MEILNCTIIQVLWHANEWNLIINSWDVITRSIKNILALKKKSPSILTMKNWVITTSMPYKL